MLTQELIEYIRQAQNAGMAPEQIRKALAESGWAETDITQALSAMNAAFDSGRAERIAASVTPATAAPVQPSVSITPQATAPVLSTMPLQTETLTPTYNEPSPRHRVRVILIITIIALLLCGGGAYAYVAYTSLPRVVATRAAEEAARVTTYETEESFKLEIRETGASASPKPVSMSIDVTAKAQYDYRASTTPRMHANIAVEVNLAGVSTKGGGEFARVGNEIFARVRDIPVAIANGLGPMYTYLHDRWFSFNGDTFVADLRAAGLPEEALTEVRTSLDQALKPKDRLKKIASMLAEDASVLTEEKGEVIGEEMTRVYTVNGTRTLWIDLFKKLAEAETEKEIEAFDELVKTIEDSVTDGTISGTIWIGKDSHRVRKIRLLVAGTVTGTPANLPGQARAQSAAFTLEYTQTFKNFNGLVEITKPDPTTSVMSIVLESLGVARAKGADAAIKSNMSGLRAQAELFYDLRKNYGPVFARGVPSSCPTTLGSTMFGSTEFQKVFANIREYNRGKPLTCATDNRSAGVESYAISSPLITGSTFCVDSSGQAVSGKTASVVGGRATCR